LNVLDKHYETICVYYFVQQYVW